MQAEKDKAADAKLKDERLKEAQELAQARIAIEQSVVSSLASLGNIFINNQKKNEAFQKSVAGIQLAIDTARAISGAVAAAQAAGPFPANLAAIATGVGSVLANIAQAKKLLSSAGSSSAPSLDVPTSVSVGGGIGSQTQQQLPQIPQTLLLPPTDQTQIVVPVESINDVNQNVTEAKALSLIG